MTNSYWILLVQFKSSLFIDVSLSLSLVVVVCDDWNLVYSLTTVLQGTFHTYFVSVITTLEKLFSIPSRTTGILMATTEIGQVGLRPFLPNHAQSQILEFCLILLLINLKFLQVSSSLLLPYFISSGHRPRWMGFGTVVFAAASLLTASLHLILPPVIAGPGPEQDYCLHPDSDGECQEETSSNILLYLILSLSLLSIGFGQTAGQEVIPYPIQWTQYTNPDSKIK